MKNIKIIFLISFTITLVSCSSSLIKKETYKKSTSTSTSTILNKRENLEENNQKFLKEKSIMMSKTEVIDLLKSTNNENPIFYSENCLKNSEKFSLISSSSKSIYDYLKFFLQKINLEELYDLEDIAGSKKLTKANCEKILEKYKSN